MDYQSIFRRYEIKYLLTEEEMGRLYPLLGERMRPDRFAKSDIRNIYYDTESYRLIRRSLEKPVYKEKLRIRSYGAARETDDVFVEIKKKYKGIVYKRRVCAPYQGALGWLSGREPAPFRSQITSEIDYLLSYYETLRPAMLLTYLRESFAGEGALRLTVDRDIIARMDSTDISAKPFGEALLPGGVCLVEVKSPTALPLWLVDFLSRERIRRVSFSKYGQAYRTLVLGEKRNARGLPTEAV